MLLAAEIPERSCETEICQKGLRFVERRPAPVGIHFVPIPSVGEPPSLIDGQCSPSWLVPLGAPILDVLLSPEEQHRLSGENDVFPPALDRNREMDHSGRR